MATVKKAPAAPAEKSNEAAMVFNFSSTGKKKADARVVTIPYKNLHVEPGFNPRKKIGDVSALEASIKTSGLAQMIVARPPKDGSKFGEDHAMIVAGERRYRALGGLGYENVTVVIRDDLKDDDLAALALAGAENGDEARQPLTHQDRGEMYKKFADQGWPIKKIAKETGAHERDVRRCLDLINAPEDVKSAFEKGKLNFSTAIQVAALDDETRKAAIKTFAAEDSSEEASQAKVKQFAKEFNKGEDTGGAKKASNKKKGKARAASLKAWKGHKAIEKQMAELCFMFINADESEVGTTRWFETRGTIGTILWMRGDVGFPVMVPNDPEEAADPAMAKKELKRINELIEAFASKHTPPPSEESSEPAEGEAESTEESAE